MAVASRRTLPAHELASVGDFDTHDVCGECHASLPGMPAMRDEADYLPYTLTSMAAQTWRPAKWVIVNDGSSDGTGNRVGSSSSLPKCGNVKAP